MRTEPVRQREPFAAPAPNRELLVEVYGPLFAAIGRLSLSAPVRLSDFVNEREGFLRLTDVEFMPDGARSAPGQPSPNSDCPICKGLAGVQLAILAAAQAGLLERDTVPVQLRPADTAAIEHIVFVPRSRGPPFSV